MDALRSLTRTEAQLRSRLLEVESYEIELDMTGLLDGNDLRSVSRIRFTCAEPGTSSFVDLAAELVEATLNGDLLNEALDSRISLPELAATNELVVESVQRSTDRGTAVHRSVDQADGEVYVWTSFEPDEARRAWACFDQPDLKAPHTFTVLAPAAWTVVSNSGGPEVEEADEGVRRWAFPATPPLSTYVPCVNAGPFHERRETRDGYALGLFSRRSLATFLDRDAEELFGLTAAGLAWFGEQFAMPFPQSSYDQVFVPDLGGAMENYGCVTYSDAFVYRTQPSPLEREERAEVLLHEMAHMWFGDIVTMRWWDDLWLNEAFAEWACYWAASRATEFVDAWASFCADAKLDAYSTDRGPTSHPIRQAAPDVAVAAAGFDMITYIKGASVLKQLAAYVGERAFVSGLRSHFAKHAWGNATLDDLMSSLSEASGRELSGWTDQWLDTAGSDLLVLEPGDDVSVVTATSPDGGDPRPHRLGVGVYDRAGNGLALRDLHDVELLGESTPLPDVRGADVLLVNDDDHTFAAVRPDPASLGQLLESAADLPTAVGRAVAFSTVWDMLMTGEVSAADLVGCANRLLVAETTESVIEPFLRHTLAAAELWAPDAQRDDLLSSVADGCLRLADHGGSRRLVALRSLARSAVTAAQLSALQDALGDDVDLGWRAQMRFAALGRFDGDAVAALRERDPDPDVWVRVLAVDAARPDPAGKDAAWATVFEKHKVPVGSLRELSSALWQPSQGELLAPYAGRYLEALPALGRAGMIVAMSTASMMFPVVGADDVFVRQVKEAAEREDVSPVVRGRVLERTDQLTRMLRSRRWA